MGPNNLLFGLLTRGGQEGIGLEGFNSQTDRLERPLAGGGKSEGRIEKEESAQTVIFLRV